MTTTYVEFETNLQCAKFEEWVGREYARDYPAVYPVPPDEWIGPPPSPPPEAYTWFYSRCAMKPVAGGVFTVDDDVRRFATEEQTLSDGAAYNFDIEENEVPFEELTPEGQAAVTPPPTP
jgi:hypothetical protein